MLAIIKVLLLLTNNYLRNIDVEIDENTLILNFMKNEKIYKTIKIKQSKEDKLKIEYINEGISKIADFEEVKEIIETIEKEINAE